MTKIYMYVRDREKDIETDPILLPICNSCLERVKNVDNGQYLSAVKAH